MIPRTKANYTLRQLFKALFITETGMNYKAHLVDLLQQYLGEDNILLMPSGRAGLYYILKAVSASRVIIPAYTCKAVAEAALLAGKDVTYVDIQDGGFNMSADALETVLDDDSVVIATHQFGIPCEIEKIVKLCKNKGALVIEDCAASLGSKIGGKLAGTFGDVAFYSFDSTKLINVPMKGGFVTAKDAILFEKIKKAYAEEIKPLSLMHKLSFLAQAAILVLLENHLLYGIFHKLFFQLRRRFTEDSPDMDLKKNHFYNYDMANWQACIALSQMSDIENIINFRREIYSEYFTRLSKCTAFELPPKDKMAEWACIRMPIRVNGNKLSYYRLAVSRGVDFAFSFTFIPCSGNYENAKRAADSVLDLPFYLKLNKSELDRVVSVLERIDKEVPYAH